MKIIVKKSALLTVTLTYALGKKIKFYAMFDA